MIARHTFARANSDDDPTVLANSDFVAGLNLALGNGNVRPVPGNVAVPYTLPPVGTNVRLGGFEDGATGTAVTLLSNSAGYHRLVRYDPAGNAGAGAETTVLEWSGLNLAPGLVPQGGVLDGLLIYLDAAGALRCVNLARAEAGGYPLAVLAAEPYALHLVKAPPTQAPTVRRQTDSPLDDARAALRVIQRRAYQFAVRWRYADGEQTVLSPYSKWSDVESDPATTLYNAVRVGLAPPSAGVAEVDVLVREPDSDGWLVADTLRPAPGGLFPAEFRFYGPVAGGAVTAAEAAKSFESCWPAAVAAVVRGRVMAAATVEGYPTPEPAFTVAVVADNGLTARRTADVYRVTRHVPFLGRPAAQVLCFVLVRGDYGAADSAYTPVFFGQQPGVTGTSGPPPQVWYLTTYQDVSYPAAFGALGPQDTLEVLAAQSVPALDAFVGARTFHENSSYRVAVQFYDAQGRPGGCSRPQTVVVPPRATGYEAIPTAPDSGRPRRVVARLTTTDPAALNAEIPAWATTYQFLVARNDRTTAFRQGLAADVLAYLGVERTVNADATTKETALLKPSSTAHEKLWVDIGNWPAAGMGYLWTPGSGDVLRFQENATEHVITGQTGDYLEVGYSGNPAGTAYRRIEIFSPNTTAADVYYERGPRLSVRRQAGQRSYALPEQTLDGDCFLLTLNFPLVPFSDAYVPPAKKTYAADPQGRVLVEGMVPQFRLYPSVTTVTTKLGTGDNNGDPAAFGFTAAQYAQAQGAGVVTTTADTFARGATALRWLDMSYGGRPGYRVPPALQQVARPTLLRFSGVKVQGSRLNGLGQWEALSQYNDLPQEQGPVTRLTVADQTETDGSVLLVNQARGDMSLSLGQGQIQTADGQALLAISRQVIGGGNALRGGYGCQHPASVVAFAGKVFFWCQRRAELLRYDRNGLTPLGLTHKFRNRLADAARRYAGAAVTGCFHPHGDRKEYLLTFGPANGLPGLTLVYSDLREAWADAVSAQPEAGLALGSELLSWRNGAGWRHTPDGPGATFYGVYAAPQLTLAVARPGGVAKRFHDLAVESASLWLATQLKTDTNLASFMREGWFTRREGVYRAGLRRASNSPGFPTIYHALDNGIPLTGTQLTITLTAPASAAPLTAVSLSTTPRSGQGMSA